MFREHKAHFGSANKLCLFFPQISVFAATEKEFWFLLYMSQNVELVTENGDKITQNSKQCPR